MFSKIWLINLLLTAMVMLVGFQAYRAWWGEKMEIPSIRPSKEASSPFEKEIFKKQAIPSTEYETIATKNLFAQDRTERIPEDKPNEPDVNPKADPKQIDFIEKEVEKIALYGVLISENEKKALVSNLEMKVPAVRTQKPFGPSFLKRIVRNQKPPVLAPASSGDRLKWVKQGDMIGRFSVTAIKNDSILLNAEGMDFTVFLYEKRGQKSVAPLKKDTEPVVVTVAPGSKSEPPPVKAEPPKQIDLIKGIQEKLKPNTNVPAGNAPAGNVPAQKTPN